MGEILSFSKSAKIERLYRKYATGMLRATMKKTDDMQLAEDAVHMAFEKVVGILDEIREEDIKATGGLMILMAQRALYDLYAVKKRGGVDLVDACAMPEIPANEADPLAILLNAETVNDLRQSLKWLDAKYADPIIMMYGYEMTNEQIAKYFGVDTNVVYTWIYRGKAKIKKYMEKGGTLS